ncbi:MULTISPECIES: flagellar motor switch protein FliM [unclassified Sphingomonas]|uniref:flagellar motor switch protein FliM n=1 Tax=unclassified Sphingomonas TaxID=196159 RepID=UPI0006FF53A3|nr:MULTISPECIES: FliM/FliN family flagellar motor switch protein [unclassified Sphingomonas]KQX26279.1 flagellar motor switch protein FliM [Sphingomonas sp. Root1294]KQY69348.1 flagellar motor switch protein FliM [Sphingomonas sp. Root50]KRB89607.1 flagellar motor switch protein FliM [Sphingomonas sp. Root720]
MTRAASSLSGDEVAALMDELSDISFDQEGAEAPKVRQARDVEPYALGQRKDRPVAHLAHLERMNERIARRLRDVIEPIAQTRSKVDPIPLETRRFDEWQRNQPDYMSLSLFRVRPVKGMMMIAIEPGFITNMVDAFYGGTGNGLTTKGGEFTPSEQRLQRRLADAIVEVLTKSWAETFPLQFELSTHETNATFANMVRADEPVVVQSFTIKPGMSRSTRIEILYPLSLMQPIEDEIAARTHAGAGGEDHEWKGKLFSALDNVALPVRSVLARPEMTVAQLLALKPGDVIPVNLSQTVPLLVGNRRFAEGTIGEQDGRAAMMIERLNKEVLK